MNGLPVRRILLLAAMTGLLLVALAAPALAHATFDVTVIPAQAAQDVVLRVPVEVDAVNDTVEVLVPGVFSVTACPGADGWTCGLSTTADGDTLTTFTRDADGPGDTELFELTLTAPAADGVYAFPTIQTYDDGTEVAWINDAGTDRPAPRIQVGDSTTEVVREEPAPAHSEDPTEADPSPTPSPIEVAESPTPDDPDSPSPGATVDGPDDDAVPEAAGRGLPALAVGLVAVAIVTAFVVRSRRRR